MGPAVAQRHAEALGAADRHVGPQLARRGQQQQRQQIGGHGHLRPGGVGPGAEGPVVVDRAVGGRVLHQRAEHPAVEGEASRGRPPPPRCPGAAPAAASTAMVWGWQSRETKNRWAVSSSCSPASICMASAAAVPSSSSEAPATSKPGQVEDHGLEVQQRLQAPLRDLGLVGGVGGVPAGILQDVAQDHRRGDAVGVAHADEAAGDPVAPGQRPGPGQQLVLAQPRPQVQLAAAGGWRAARSGRSARRASPPAAARSISATSSSRGPLCRPDEARRTGTKSRRSRVGAA